MDYFPVIQTLISNSDHHVDMLRLDMIDEEISGNKWFKLKYNIEAAKKENHDQIITFGGAFSNHLAATAAACKKFKLKCVGIIRGEEPSPLNPTLLKAKKNGMHLYFVSREEYDKKTELEFQAYLTAKFGKHYLVPEGGNNEAGIKGCMEIIHPEWNYDYIFCACGTGATYAGILASLKPEQKLIGISVLKGENALVDEVKASLQTIFSEQHKTIKGNEEIEKRELQENCITNKYAFKGYAKFDQVLIDFKQKFELDYKINLDYVYTNKLLYAVFDLLTKEKIKKKSKILIVHSGGLQGNSGFEDRYHLIPTR